MLINFPILFLTKSILHRSMPRVESQQRWMEKVSMIAKRFMKSMGLRFASRLMFPPVLSATTTRAPAMQSSEAGVDLASKDEAVTFLIELGTTARMKFQCSPGTMASSGL